MTIREIYNIRIARIKDWMESIRSCRYARHSLEQAEKNITRDVDADMVEDVRVCIKQYFTTMPAIDVFETGDNVYFHSMRCQQFFEKPCPVKDCPLWDKNAIYRHCQSLLSKARDERRAAFKLMFGRIK